METCADEQSHYLRSVTENKKRYDGWKSKTIGHLFLRLRTSITHSAMYSPKRETPVVDLVDLGTGHNGQRGASLIIEGSPLPMVELFASPKRKKNSTK